MQKLTALIVVAVLGGCGGGKGDGASQPVAGVDQGVVVPGQGGAPPLQSSVQERIVALEQSGALPTLDRGPSLAGPDVNANGVRDDVDAFIASKYTDTNHRAAATQHARSLQAAVLVDPTNRPAMESVVQQIARAVHCVHARFPAGALPHAAAVGAQIQAVTTSTKARLQAYLAFNRAFNGGSVELPQGDTCE